MSSLLFLGGLAFLFISIFICLALYLLLAFGLYGMGKNAGVEHSWVAFIPIINTYVLGKIIKEIKISKYVLPYPEIILPIATFFCLFFRGFGVLGALLLLCVFILYAASFYRLYTLYRPESVALYTVISVIVPITVPFFFFLMRKENPVDSEESSKEIPVSEQHLDADS